MKHFFNPLSRTLLILLSVGLCVACSDKWNEHYSVGSSVPQSTILDKLALEEGTENFIAVLTTTKVMVGDKMSDKTYAELLDGDQFFTVWAPLNSSLDNEEWGKYMKTDKTLAENSEVVQKFLNNHMSRSKYSEDGKSKTVLMMSSKHYVMNDSDIEGAEFEDTNIPCLNGIIHTLKTKLEYKPNLYEYLISADSPYADNLGAFLLKYHKKELNKEKSVLSNLTDENDNPIYADSVMEVKSAIMDLFGYINSEDSVYNMILPVPESWDAALEAASAYYHFGKGAAADSDSLTTYWSNNALLTDAVFNMNSKMQPYNKPETGMRMISTSYDMANDPVKTKQYHTYEQPFVQDFQFHFVDSVICSNGKLYMCSEWPFDPYYTYAKPIIVEAEDEASLNLAGSTSGVQMNVTNQLPFELNGITYRLSEDKFMRLNSGSPYSVVYKVPQNLSGWNAFYAVIAPNNITRDKIGMAAKKNQISVSVTIKDINKIFSAKDESGNTIKFVTDIEKLDTVYVGTFLIPDCYYGLNSSNMDITFSQTANKISGRAYSQEIYLDCLIVKPTTAPEE